MELIIASNNNHKINEIKQILGNRFENVFSMKDKNISHETVEDGLTFEQNAIKKALELYRITKTPSLSDDSGLCVNALNGEPGIYSARFAGTPCNDDNNNRKLLKLLENETDRTAFYECVIAICFDENNIITASGRTYGKILTHPDGTGGFGYDPLFFSDELKKTFANSTSKEKNSVSHRAKAMNNLLSKLDCLGKTTN